MRWQGDRVEHVSALLLSGCARADAALEYAVRAITTMTILMPRDKGIS